MGVYKKGSHISDRTSIPVKRTRLLVSAFSRCMKTSLRAISFEVTGMDNERAGDIVTAGVMH